MSAMESTTLHRRGFLTGGISFLGGLALTPSAARAARRALDSQDDGRRLVLLQLSGGNDGLSTVVPFEDDAYARARETTRMGAKDVLRIAENRGLHGALGRLKAEWDEGRVAIVEGVGYERMIRSHFRALEVWHTGQRAGRNSGEGWVGRLAQSAWKDQDHPELVVHLGRNAPYSVYSTTHPAVALESPTGYQWFGSEPEAEVYRMAGGALQEEARGRPPAARHAGRDSALAKLRGVLDDARDSSLRIRRAAASYRPLAEYPRNLLGATLRDVAALTHAGMGTRVYSVALGGFDTHAAQRGSHDSLMRILDGALGAFLEDLSYSAEGRETVVLVFSEFGRRVQENASRGTDHGKAGPMFLFGSKVAGGLYGAHPSLEELESGDLGHTTDFRSVYGALIEDWFGIPHERVLGVRYPRLELFG